MDFLDHLHADCVRIAIAHADKFRATLPPGTGTAEVTEEQFTRMIIDLDNDSSQQMEALMNRHSVRISDPGMSKAIIAAVGLTNHEFRRRANLVVKYAPVSY